MDLHSSIMKGGVVLYILGFLGLLLVQRGKEKHKNCCSWVDK